MKIQNHRSARAREGVTSDRERVAGTGIVTGAASEPETDRGDDMADDDDTDREAAPPFWVEAVPTPSDPEAPADAPPASVHLRVSGDLDQSTSPSLEAAALGALETGAQVVVVDLSAVMFVDSAGLRAIVTAANAAEARGVRMLVAGMSGGVERLLQLTGLLERLRREQPDEHPSPN